MADRHIIVLYGNKFLVATKRTGMDDNYVVLADTRNESAAERLINGLNSSEPAPAPAQRPAKK